MTSAKGLFVAGYEEWNPVVGFEAVYSVSRVGSVRIEVQRHNMRKGKHLRQTMDRDGYLYVRLSLDGKKGVNRRVHRIVACAFICPIPAGMQINHLDGVRHNNRVKNLEIVTPKENIHHAMKELGRDHGGERNPSAKLTAKQVVEIRKRRAGGVTLTVLAADFSVTTVLVGKIVRGHFWKKAGGPITASRSKPRVALSDDDAIAAMRAVIAGEDIGTVAERYGVTANTLRGWLNGRARTHLTSAIR